MMEPNERKLFEAWKSHRETQKIHNRKRNIETALYVSRAKDKGIKVTREEVAEAYTRQYGQ